MSNRKRSPLQTGAVHTKPAGVRHFLDLDCVEPKTLRRIIDAAHAMKAAGKRVPQKLRPKAIEDQMKHGKTTLIEAMINQELGDPFRRDAMKKPVVVAGIDKADMRAQ